ILLQGKASPWEILAVTFTNRAAREMQHRVSSLTHRPVDGWWVGTFHSVAARILRSHAEGVGLRPNFTILDTDDQLRLIKQHLEARHIDPKKWPARRILGVIERWKDRGLTPDRVSAAEGSDVVEGQVLEIYGEYQARLRTLNAADFGDLLLHCLTLFQTDPEILKSYQSKFRYVMVDEYQDTNVAQYLWMRLLGGGYKNVCCVGDDDQSIYSWRGAEVGNILRFEDDFPGAKIVRLERNYRSTPHILAAASGLISYNEGRLGKTLWTDLNDGELVRVRGVWDGEEEARVTGEDIEAYQTKGQSLNEMAVLVRAGFQTREFEERLITLGVPYRVVGGPRFYERREIRDAVAYLRVISQPADDLAFERIVNVPKRGLGQATLQTIHQLGRAEQVPLVEAVRSLVETDELKPKQKSTLTGLVQDFDRWRDLSSSMPPSELAGLVLDESDYTGMWKRDKSIEAPGRLDNLKELIVALEDFETLTEFLEHVSLVMENDESNAEEKVTLMTLHSAKGLEFETVFLPGWEEGLFPHQRSLEDTGGGGLEEERRLAYVGLTRARQRAIVSYAANRRVYGKWQSAIPSRFVGELPDDHIESVNSMDTFGSGPWGETRGGGAGRLRETKRFGNSRSGAPLIEDTNWKTQTLAGTASTFTIGQRIFHQKFGYGIVRATDGNKLEISFEKAGTKKVIDSFVESA
ncbi:MAG: UvrD-helicase domain-containing protein, partial [Rhodospirillales bacterium]|nr:UvrD-helicase domain-containing protein [Rhodospirillales bacterium]